MTWHKKPVVYNFLRGVTTGGCATLNSRFIMNTVQMYAGKGNNAPLSPQTVQNATPDSSTVDNRLETLKSNFLRLTETSFQWTVKFYKRIQRCSYLDEFDKGEALVVVMHHKNWLNKQIDSYKKISQHLGIGEVEILIDRICREQNRVNNTAHLYEYPTLSLNHNDRPYKPAYSLTSKIPNNSMSPKVMVGDSLHSNLIPHDEIKWFCGMAVVIWRNSGKLPRHSFISNVEFISDQLLRLSHLNSAYGSWDQVIRVDQVVHLFEVTSLTREF